MNRFLKLCVAWIISTATLLNAADPTDNRPWKSAAGTTIEAKATAMAGEVVTLQTPAGRTLKVELSKLSEEDQAFLKTHFGTDAATQTPVELAHPQGTTVGPIKAEDSNYYLYLPKSLQAGQKAPLLFVTGSGGGSPGGLDLMIEGAELCGWILAMSVESKNGIDEGLYLGYAKQCLEHLSATLPINPDRIYFGGDSGGSRVAFSNSSKIETAGVLAIIAGAQPGELSRKKHYFFINGSTDYNRYGSAVSFAEVKANSTIRFHPGSHSSGPSWLVTEGIVWLEAKWREKSKTIGPQQIAFETAAMAWIDQMKTTEPHRAAWWANHLATTGLSPQTKPKAQAIITEQASKPDTANYANAIAEIEKFTATTLAAGPQYSPACFNHTDPEIQKKVDKMLESYSTTPWIKEVLAALKEKTGQG